MDVTSDENSKGSYCGAADTTISEAGLYHALGGTKVFLVLRIEFRCVRALTPQGVMSLRLTARN
jgi:hypothetical protein